MLSFNTTQQHNTSQLDKTLSQKDEPQFFAVITALPSNLPTGPELAIKFEERGVRKVTTKEVSEKLPPQGKFSADWSKTCRQVGSDSSHHSFSRLVQYLPSSRVGFRRTDGPKYFSSHLMAVLSFSRLVQNSPSSRVGFPSPQFQPTGPIPAVKSGRIPVTTVSADWSNTCRQVGSDSRHHSFSRLVQYLPSSRVGFRRTDGRTDGRTKIFFQSPDGSSQFQPTGPKLAFKSGRIPTDGRTDGPTFFVQSPHGSSQFQPTSPKLAFKSGRIPVHTVQADWSKTCRQVGSDSDGLEGIACCCTDLAQGLLGGVSCLLLSRLALEGVL